MLFVRLFFVFMNPAPTEESLDDFYKNRYWEFYFHRTK